MIFKRNKTETLVVVSREGDMKEMLGERENRFCRKVGWE